MTIILILITIAAILGWVLFGICYSAYQSMRDLWEKHPTGHVLMPGIGEKFAIKLSDNRLVQVVVNSITWDSFDQSFTGTFKEIERDRH